MWRNLALSAGVFLLCLASTPTLSASPDRNLGVTVGNQRLRGLKSAFFVYPPPPLPPLRYLAQAQVQPNAAPGDASAPAIPEDDAPIADALGLLAELHRGRNYQPFAATVHALLEATRAHAGFLLRPGGHQILANVARVDFAAVSSPEQYTEIHRMLVSEVSTLEQEQSRGFQRIVPKALAFRSHAAPRTRGN